MQMVADCLLIVCRLQWFANAVASHIALYSVVDCSRQDNGSFDAWFICGYQWLLCFFCKQDKPMLSVRQPNPFNRTIQPCRFAARKLLVLELGGTLPTLH